MKNIISFIFAAVLGVILTGCGGGGGGDSFRVSNVETPVYFPEYSGRLFPDLTAANRELSTNGISITLALSGNVIPGSDPGRPEYNIIVQGGAVGDAYTIRAGGGASYRVLEQNGTHYLAVECINDSFTILTCEGNINGVSYNLVTGAGDVFRAQLSIRTFILPNNVFTVTSGFYFNRGLIENAHQFGNFYINAENKHAEYRWTPFSDVFIDGGFRRFGNADVVYTKMQMDYKDFYLQYTAGNIRSDYYKEGNINGVAFGWQKDNFAVKAEKPFSNGGEKWIRLFYQREF